MTMPSARTSSSPASKAVDRQLKRYRSIRDFNSTLEPRGSAEVAPQSASNQALPFVVQKHAATRLHYDFRLGWRGVLKSWAVTKGPSLFPGDKRLAVQVEDHPIEYGGFEGTIPKGQYGGGTVMVWDFGEWEPEGDVDRGLKDGHLKFKLRGKKLKGKWALVRMHGHGGNSDKPNWLLIKEKDAFARPADTAAITEEAADSAVTKRNLEQIASSDDHTWKSKAGHGPSSANARSSPLSKATRERPSDNDAKLSDEPALSRHDAPLEAFPRFIPPQLATLATTAPVQGDWIHELKLDGYRIQVHMQNPEGSKGDTSRVKLFTRTGLDWTSRMSAIAHDASQLHAKAAILDGEVVALDPHGVSSFADLQAAFQQGKHDQLIYFAFDLLHLDGRGVRHLPLLRRKELLAHLLGKGPETSRLRLSEHLSGSGETIFHKACLLGAEGIISKLASAAYTPGRSSSWLKVKCKQEQEFVIGGFTLPSNGSAGIGALLLGYYRDGSLCYAGRSGTGFTQKSQKTLREKLNTITREVPAFGGIPQVAQRGVQWVEPRLVAQIAFANWTRDGLVRHGAFKGLREDKPAHEVVREVPAADSASGRAQVDPAKKASPPLKARMNSVNNDRDLPITHPEKILDATSGMTKLSLARYYLSVADRMLPHIAARPLSVVRCPEGSGKPCFYQKHVGLGLPKGVQSIAIPNRKTGKMEDFLTVDSPEGLVGMAQMGVLEIHPWGSRNESLEKPDRIVFDLDPDASISWKTLAASALDLRQRLKKLGLKSFLKSTGGKGLHIVVPIEPTIDWARAKQFAHDVALEMEKENPSLYITKMTKAARKNRIYLDYLRNDRESTAIAPWSPRARAGAPVAMPLDWKELEANEAPSFHVGDLPQWQHRLQHDPWKAMARVKQRIADAAKK